jgi:hypothetical protein
VPTHRILRVSLPERSRKGAEPVPENGSARRLEEPKAPLVYPLEMLGERQGQVGES